MQAGKRVARFMSRRKKLILGIVIFLIVIFTALLVLLPRLLDVDRYRPRVTALIQQQMGRSAEIGHLALSILPRLSIRVDGFALRNPAGFPAGYFVQTKRIYAEISAGELLEHRIVIRSLELEAPEISLIANSKGNWNTDPPPSSAADPAPDPPGEKPLFTLGVISALKMSHGQLSVANLLPTGQIGPAFVVAGGVKSELRQVDLNALLARESGAVPPRQQEWPTNIAFAAESTAAPAAEGTLELDTLHVLNIAVTELKSKLRLFPKQVLLDGWELTCYGGRGSGNVSFVFNGPNPSYNTQARLSGVNMANLLDAFPDTRGKITGTLDATVDLDGEIAHSPDPLAGIGGAGHLTVLNGRIPALKWDQNLLQLVRLAKMGPVSGDPSAFSSIAVDFSISNDRINTSKVNIIGNGVDADASGSLGLAGKGSLDYQGVARITTNQNALTTLLGGISGATLAKGKMILHFNVAGTLQNPQFTLKPGGAGGTKDAAGVGKSTKP